LHAHQGSHRSSPPPRHGLQGFQPSSMSFVNTNTGYLLGYAATTGPIQLLARRPLLARTDDGGRRWHRVPVPERIQTVNDGASTVHFLTQNIGFIIGRRTYLTTDGARRWRQVDRGLRIVDLDAAAGQVWALAHPCHRCHDLILYAAALSHPRLRRVPHAPRFRHGGARFIHGSGDEVYVVTAPEEHRGRIFRSYRGGAWTKQREPCPSFGSFAAWSDAGIAAVCNVIMFGAGSETKRAYVSFNGAHSWTRRGTPGASGYIGPLAVGSSDDWVLAEDRGAFLTTIDDGADWAYTGPAAALGEGVGDTQFTDANHVVAIPDFMPNRVFMYSNAGLRWAVHRFPKWPRHRA
jgi:hypothetical protein